MEYAPKITIDLPESVFQRLEDHIKKAVAESLASHIAAVKAEPELLTREQVSKRLRASFTTLHRWEISGKLIPQRAGRKIFYTARQIEMFLNER